MSHANPTLISIIIPAYNVEQYIEKAINSALHQTHSNIEVIVVNDGSSDSTLAVIESTKERLADSCYLGSRSISIVDQSNSGVMLARKAAIMAAKGDFIYFLDADDYMVEDAIDHLLAAQQNSNLDVVCAGHFRRSQAYTIEIKPKACKEVLKGNEFLLSLITNEMEGYLCGRLYRRSLFDELHYPKELSLAEDKYLNIQLACKSPRVGMIDKPVFYYVKRLESITHQHHPIAYHFKLADIIETELKRRLTPAQFAEVANHIVVMRLKFYYLYINSTSNPSMANEPYIKQLYEQAQNKDVAEIMSSSFTHSERSVIALHRHRLTAPIGKVLTAVLRIMRSISKRVGG